MEKIFSVNKLMNSLERSPSRLGAFGDHHDSADDYGE
jgi:hypothetical protein